MDIHFFMLAYIHSLLSLNCYCLQSDGLQDKVNGGEVTTTKSIFDFDKGLLIISTLNGSLLALDQKTGAVKWSFQNEPAVKVLMKSKTSLSPLFLPDPKDGSLYLLNKEDQHGVTKLPLTIQQLVTDSPSRSNDGIFYLGKKIDSWISLDAATGEKKEIFDSEGFEKACPLQFPNVFFVGKTEYNLAIFDSKTNSQNWNITYTDYTSRTLSNDHLSSYGYVHVSSSSSGRIRTYDKQTREVLWDHNFGSPMVSLYIQFNLDIYSLPFTSAADESIDFIPLLLYDGQTLQSTLYIGEHNHGFYALSALADDNVPILPASSLPPRYLIGGPGSEELNKVLILGHYKMPSVKKSYLKVGGKAGQVIYGTPRNISRRNTFISSAEQTKTTYWTQESKIIVVFILILTILVGAMFMYIMRQVREIKQSSQGSSETSAGPVQVFSEQKGVVTVGKISFNTQHILGKGCEGTFVFKGKFDNRDVAVKRLLPECFTIADREVELLRESDSHANVIRYFSTEQDHQFRYIALELCSATLQDFVEKNIYKEEISEVEVLKQATLGLDHLHSLKIVHRDIKPHNILLALGNSGSIVRVMISDFGFCKKLANGKNSFSMKSGMTGTEGWIAPEMMKSSARVMSSVDIFSLGCVFHYTICGKHPFGDTFRRQNNILLGNYKVSQLSDELWKSLILRMISGNPKERPSATTVKNHPVFWRKAFTLTFLQDVSDRVEKETLESEVLLALERGGHVICLNGDWKSQIHQSVAEDLGKYRSYRGDSIRDLLRAFRNKRHHFRELCETAQELLGPSPETYVDYWLTKFPNLLYHVWSSLQFLSTEPTFTIYYDSSYSFHFDKTDTLPTWISEPFRPRKNKSLKTSPYKSLKKRMRYDQDKDAWKSKENEIMKERDNNAWSDRDKEAWIKSGEENGAWRPRALK